MVEYVQHTRRRNMTRARAARIFLANNGVCGGTRQSEHGCGRQIRSSDSWEIEHYVALSLGGSDDDGNCYPIHAQCHKAKTAADAKTKARRDRLVTKGFKDMDRPKRGGFQTNRDSSIKMTILHGPVDRRTGEPIGRKRG